MLVSLDVQILESDADDLAAVAELWRSFLNLGIFMLKMAATLWNFFCGMSCYRKPTRCPIAASPLNFHTFFTFGA